MEALVVILSILLVIFNVYLGIRVNNWSLKKYKYKPFNLAVFSLMCLSAIFVLVSIFLLPDKGSFRMFIHHIIEFNVNESELNSLVCLIAGVLITLGTWIRISLKTNLFVGTYAAIVQLAAALILVFVLLLWLFGRRTKKDERG